MYHISLLFVWGRSGLSLFVLHLVCVIASLPKGIRISREETQMVTDNEQIAAAILAAAMFSKSGQQVETAETAKDPMRSYYEIAVKIIKGKD